LYGAGHVAPTLAPCSPPASPPRHSSPP